MIRTVEAWEVVRVKASGPLHHLCPHVDEADHGTVTVEWTTRGRTIELHSLAAWFATFANETISHEGLTAHIKETLEATKGIAGVVVRTTWTTAGMDVVVSR